MDDTVEIDDQLLEEAMQVTGLDDPVEAVHAALRELIEARSPTPKA